MAEKKWRFGFQLYGQALPCQGCENRQLVLDSLSRGSNPVNRHLWLLHYVLLVGPARCFFLFLPTLVKATW